MSRESSTSSSGGGGGGAGESARSHASPSGSGIGLGSILGGGTGTGLSGGRTASTIIIETDEFGHHRISVRKIGTPSTPGSTGPHMRTQVVHLL